MEQIRSLLLGENNEHITQVVKENAREIVKSVISEAMHDRQREDDSLAQTMTPMIESAVEQSVANNKTNFVTYLYPVVGGLVRKSVAVFFNGFLEKLNSLIENSLTIKGLKWRFQAWRLGIPFTRYIIKKTFIYRVEQVFFIHRDTGLLLNHVVLENSQFNDANLVSAMLTAINDFMVDSFNTDTKDNLNIVKTENFTLAIQAGPQALLVAAVSGVMPNELQVHLQHSLEDLHSLYRNELKTFDGDDQAFNSSDAHLRKCLLTELNPNTASAKKKPIMAIIVVASISLLLLFWGFITWQQSAFIKKIMSLPQPDGIYIQRTDKLDSEHIAITYFRDPAAVDLKSWLAEQHIQTSQITFTEIPYVSLSATLVLRKAKQIIQGYDKISLTLNNSTLLLSGQVPAPLPLLTLMRLESVPGIETVDVNQLVVQAPPQSQAQVQQAQLRLFKQKISSLIHATIDFDIQSNSLTTQAKAMLSHIGAELLVIENLATRLNIPVGIIISGYSDYTGNTEKNRQLSESRALVVKEFLLNMGVPASLLFAVGVGEVKINAVANESRKVVFSSIYLSSIEKELQ